MIKNLRNLKKDNSGASAAEYALIIALVGVAIIAGASRLGTQINNRLSATATTISNAS
ncbi:Flp family type IVb pilin [Sandarakinorhabdus sp. DWP1-3-1]|uniref:Flp family type IVb pilin n=1 Tax=Sandarakinorhabdus sp. DWP1-3-1 TaxID=2804627 RepID=UPI003CF597D0